LGVLMGELHLIFCHDFAFPCGSGAGVISARMYEKRHWKGIVPNRLCCSRR
jgi:hypothetical protein